MAVRSKAFNTVHVPVTRKKTSQGTPGRGRSVRQGTSTLNKHKRRSQSRYRGQGR